MFQKGWYKLEPADQQQLQQKHQQFQNYTTTNFHMADKISSNYMKKAALTIRVNAACLFLFCCRLQQTCPNSIHWLQTYNVFDGSESRK